MVAAGYLTDDEANRWRARPVVVRQRPDFFRTIVALLRRARAPRHRPPLRREEAARGRPRHRDHARALDRRLRRRRTSTSRCASSTSGRAGAGRSRASPAPAADEFRAPRRRPLRRRAARRGAALPRARRGGAADGATRVRVGKGDLHAAARRDDVGGPVQRQGRHQRQAAGVDGRRAARRRRRLGEERAPVEAARGSPTGPTTPRARCSGCPPTTRPRPARPPKRPQPSRSSCRWSRRRACRGRSSATTTTPATSSRWSAATTTTAREFNRVVAGLPPAGLDLQADVLLAGARSRLRLHVAAQRRAARRGRSDHRRGLDADQPQQHRRVPGHARVRADLVEERARRCSCSSWWAARTSRPGRGGSASRRRSSPTRRWRSARRARASTS